MAIPSTRALAASVRQQLPMEEKNSPNLSLFSRLLFFLLPSFVQRRIRPGDFAPRRIRETSWLDGLRGVAALFVYVNHYTGRNFSKLQYAYGDYEVVSWSSPLQLPFIRVIFCGFPMVHIFFIISGFALSYKPLRLIRSKKFEELNVALASSVFRRGFRLFLPAMASSFSAMLCWYFGFHGETFPTFWEHIFDWYSAFWKITDSWSWDTLWYPAYDVHLWTIGIEFSHSMLLFVLIIGTSRMRTTIRFSCLFVFMLYSMKCGHWGPAEFVAGMMISELTHIQQEEVTSSGDLIVPRLKAITPKRIAITAFFTFNLMMGLFIAGWPSGNVEQQPGLGFLYRNTMEPFWSWGGNMIIFPWYALGAVQIVVAIHQIPILQKIFTSSAGQYLGDISFSLYLMHGPTQVVWEPRIVPHIWTFVVGEGEAGMWRYTMAWFLTLFILAPPTIWTADIFWRAVDVNSVKVARWLEGKCTVT